MDQSREQKKKPTQTKRTSGSRHPSTSYQQFSR